MKNLLVKFIRDEEGAAAAEYAIILAVIGAVIIAAATTLQTSISGVLTRIATILDGV
jgi:pilus assembly protein Flp/PilA